MIDKTDYQTLDWLNNKTIIGINIFVQQYGPCMLISSNDTVTNVILNCISSLMTYTMTDPLIKTMTMTTILSKILIQNCVVRAVTTFWKSQFSTLSDIFNFKGTKHAKKISCSFPLKNNSKLCCLILDDISGTTSCEVKWSVFNHFIKSYKSYQPTPALVQWKLNWIKLQ